MQVWAYWTGGSSYANWEIDKDLETFRSLTAAKNAFEDRWSHGYSFSMKCEYVNRPAESNLMPCVDENSYMWVYFADPTGKEDQYPDRIIEFGPKGGIQVNPA